MKSLGELIHQGRLKMKVTMSKVAEETGLSIMYISELENGKKMPTRGDSLEKIAKYLGLDIQELRNAAAYSKVQSLMSGNNSNVLQGKFALARRLILSEIDDSQVAQISKILRDQKEIKPE